MKVLFFIVSLMGASYLFYQAIDASIFGVAPENTAKTSELGMDAQSKQGQDDFAEKKSEEHESAVLADLKARAHKLEQENKALLKQKQVLENKIASMERDAGVAIEQTLSNAALKQDEKALAKANRPIQGLELTPSSKERNVKPVSIAISEQESEQQKRLRQQAKLRDIAQKMQLAAIDALNTSQ